jgi:plastocyanin
MAALLFAAVTACGGDDSPTAPGGGGGGGGVTPTVTTNVSVSNNAFAPDFIQVSPGATVTWTWSESGNHNVTFADASITDIGNQTSGAHTSVMPSATGDYTYQCTNHVGMNGSVRVQ